MTSPLDQKLRVTGPVIVTANRLGDGAVVYLTEAGAWTEEIARAAVVDNEPAARKLLAIGVADDVGAVGAYVAPVKLATDGAVLPGNLREHIRLRGPTIMLPIPFGV
jgi:hypothetical protein